MRLPQTTAQIIQPGAGRSQLRIRGLHRSELTLEPVEPCRAVGADRSAAGDGGFVLFAQAAGVVEVVFLIAGHWHSFGIPRRIASSMCASSTGKRTAHARQSSTCHNVPLSGGRSGCSHAIHGLPSAGGMKGLILIITSRATGNPDLTVGNKRPNVIYDLDVRLPR